MEIAKIKPTNYVYNKKQMIGKGSFGEVYLGYNEKQHFPVAVKIVSFQKISSIMNKQTLMSKLKQQIVNMQIAKNQNLVQLLDAQVSARNIYIICEYCNGQSFDAFLKRKVYLTEPEALNFFQEILRAFQNLHSKKIVHRDLKPANLLMHNFNIKVADLGFSKAIDQHEQLLDSIVGTPLYMSPQIFNRQQYTEKTDIWSLGVILYQMLYGRIPWKAKSLIQLKQKVQNQPVQFPIAPTVSSNTKRLIQSMLQLQEKKRVSWQQLFHENIMNQFSPIYNQSNSVSEMVQQKLQYVYPTFFSQLFIYIQKMPYIQSQAQVLKLLLGLSVLPASSHQTINSQTAEQYFSSKYFITTHRLEILSYCFYFFGRRNRICYLIKIFQFLTKAIQQIQNDTKIVSIGDLYASMLMIVKFAIHSLHKMINQVMDKQQQQRISQLIVKGPCLYPKYIHLLLQYDYSIFINFYDNFMNQFYQPKMKQLCIQDPGMFNEINKQLGGLYKNQIGDYKFVKFMLTNCLKSTFNRLKDIQPKSHNILVVTHMIYEFQKDSRLFQLGDLLQSMKNHKNSNNFTVTNNHDLNKKYNEWIYDTKWQGKLNSIQEMKIQSLNTFISKQFKWNPLHIYANDILK